MKPPARPPLVLAFDCACSALSVAVTRGEAILAEHYEARSQGQAAMLAPTVQHVLRNAGIKAAELDLIGVTIGPGSFTGIRIGLAFARGLALALDRPLAARSSFAAVTDAVPPARRDPGQILIAAMDSRREEIFLRVGDAPPSMKHPLEAVTDLPRGRYALIGDAAPDLMLAFTRSGRQGECAVLASAPPRARDFAPVFARQGIEYWRERNRSEGLPQPLYLRAPDVTLGSHKAVPI
jgi:tRNA threonylcarbamoyladenosine biosynthesis protein TsaB